MVTNVLVPLGLLHRVLRSSMGTLTKIWSHILQYYGSFKLQLKLFRKDGKILNRCFSSEVHYQFEVKKHINGRFFKQSISCR